jgi:quercetin dioxygenase-like cupin family protein
MHITLPAAFLLLAATLTPIPVNPSAPLFENDQVKVTRAMEKRGVQGKFHQHDMDRVMVYLQSARQQFEYQDGRKTEVFDWKAGQVEWNPPTGMHSPLALDHDFNIVEIELKNSGTSKAIASNLDPLKVDPNVYKLEFENPQVRVLRVTIPPHASTPMHAHSTNRVTVLLTDQKFQTKDASGKTAMVEHKAGDVVWGTPTEHAEQNLSDEPFEAVTVEVK